ncbi:hypothetical protein U1Q18_036487 [Sarracenia purpurea var. burkii]
MQKRRGGKREAYRGRREDVCRRLEDRGSGTTRMPETSRGVPVKALEQGFGVEVGDQRWASDAGVEKQ